MLAVLTTVLCAFEKPPGISIDDNSDVSVVRQNEAIKGTLYAFSFKDEYSDPASMEIPWAHFQANGETDAIEMKYIDISHYHVAEIQKDGRIEFRKGEFYIYSADGHTVYGTYYGFGEKNNEQFTAEWMLKIEGGTGRYAGASGYLKEVITSENDVNDLNGGIAYKVDLSGSISLPENLE